MVSWPVEIQYFFHAFFLACELMPKLSCMCMSNVVSDVFITWDGATHEFESSNHIAEGIITLAWHKQQIVILQYLVTTGPIKFTAFLIFCES